MLAGPTERKSQLYALADPLVKQKIHPGQRMAVESVAQNKPLIYQGVREHCPVKSRDYRQLDFSLKARRT